MRRVITQLGDAEGMLAHADRTLLALALLSFVVAPACSALAWRCALVRREASLGYVDAGARYGIGCLVNTLVPAHLGSGLRVALLGASLPAERRVRSTAAAGAVLSAARTFAVVALLAASLAPAFGVAALVVCCVFVRGSVRWTLLAALARVGAVACALSAFGVPGAVGSALVLVPAIELAGFVQLTPANLGVVSAVAAFVLAQRGAVDTVAVGIAVHAVETAAGLSFGLASGVVLVGLRIRRRSVSSAAWRAWIPAPKLPARSSSPA